MKIMTLFGTRPEIIRLSLVIKELDRFCQQVLVHTGQNYDPNLSDIFFRELGVRQPDIHLGIQSSSFAEQAGQIITKAGEALAREKPDRLLILGDTNSGLAAIVAARMGIPVFHMEAGNRAYDNRIPEEINRRIIDHSSDVLLPYTARSKDNLVREGIDRARIFVTGNPIYEVLQHFSSQIEASPALENMRVQPGAYFLVTLHRAENVDQPERLRDLFDALIRAGDRYDRPVIVSVHPRTMHRITQFNILEGFHLHLKPKRLILSPPMGFFDFVKLEQHAGCVISDSGTVQEECAIFNVPNVTLRDVTERPETIEAGSNILSGAAVEDVLRTVEVVLNTPSDWIPPTEYVVPRVSRTVTKILLSYHHRPV